MAIKERKPEALQEQSKHLLYEIQMLFALGRYFETRELDAAVAGLDRDGMPVRNAVVEAFEIHARQLIEFLTHQRNARRATARDWAKGWSVPKAETQALKALREAFSERVAHLSWKRSVFTPDEQLVMTHEIERKLRPLLRRFLAEADPEGLCQGFAKEVRFALSSPEPERPAIEAAAEFGLAGAVTPPETLLSVGGTATKPLSQIAENVRRRS